MQNFAITAELLYLKIIVFSLVIFITLTNKDIAHSTLDVERLDIERFIEMRQINCRKDLV